MDRTRMLTELRRNAVRLEAAIRETENQLFEYRTTLEALERQIAALERGPAETVEPRPEARYRHPGDEAWEGKWKTCPKCNRSKEVLKDFGTRPGATGNRVPQGRCRWCRAHP